VMGPTLAVNVGAGSAFHAPTFNDLYYPYGYGNPNLKPEQSRSIEAGVSGAANIVHWSVQTYQTKARDLIVLDSNYVPANVSEARLRGAEITLNAQWQHVTSALNYTVQSPLSQTAGSNYNHLLPRRSRQAGRLELGYDFGRAQIGSVINAVGQRYDDLANTQRLPGYATVDFKAEVQLVSHLNLQVKLGNFFDRQYETARFYNQEGRTLTLTLRYRQ